jgi:hypothetical protein
MTLPIASKPLFRKCKEHALLWASAILAGALCARLIIRVPSLMFVVVLFTTALLVGLGLEFLVAIIVRSARKESKGMEIEDFERTINAMPFHEVKTKAYAILKDPAKFNCTLAKHAPPNDVSRLASGVAELLTTYSSVASIRGEAKLGWALVAPSELQPEFIRLGQDMDATELVVKPTEERFYQVDGSEETETELLANSYLSVFHWVLCTSHVLYD